MIILKSNFVADMLVSILRVSTWLDLNRHMFGLDQTMVDTSTIDTRATYKELVRNLLAMNRPANELPEAVTGNNKVSTDKLKGVSSEKFLLTSTCSSSSFEEWGFYVFKPCIVS